MAVAKLGMIITDIAGSIGGTTLKRQSGNIAVYNKSRGPNKSVTLQNKALGRMNSGRALWRGLTLNEKSEWSNAAGEYTFPDKFGVPRNITGYQLFTKMYNGIAGNAAIFINGNQYNQDIYSFSISDYEISFETKQCNLSVDYNDETQYFLCSFDVNCKEASKPIFNKRKIIFAGYSSVDFTMQIDQFFWNAFPWVQIGQNVRVYVTPMNDAGYKGVALYADFIVR